MALREQQKASRRERILSAARRLIRTAGADGLGMRALARAARLSHATPYNHFASKADILFALFEQSLDRLDRAVAELPVSDPLERLYAIMDRSVEQFAADDTYYRALMQALAGASDTTHPPRVAVRIVTNLGRAVRAAVAAGQLLPDLSPGLVAWQLFLNHRVALELWTHDQLDTEGFYAQSRYGMTICLLAAATESTRPILRQRLAVCEQELGRSLGRLLPK